MLETLQRLEEDKKISKKDAEQLIQELCFGQVSKFNHKVVGLMTGFNVEVKELDSPNGKTPTGYNSDHFKEIVLTPHPYGRNHKEGYKPQPLGIFKFHKMVERLAEYQVFNVELRGKSGPKQEKDERTLMSLYDPVFRQQGHVFRAWQEILIDFQLGENSYSFTEMMKDYAHFIGYLTEYKKLVNKLLKSEKRLMDIYDDILKDFDPKYNWFGFALEDAMLLASADPTAKVPCQLGELKKAFWTQVKESSKEAREFFNQ